MFKELATSRRFAPLFWCQLCSALNDNFLKNALVMLILYGLGGAGSAVGDHGPALVTLAGVVFIAPFFILSALGGELADRYDKAQVAASIKLAEIPIAGLAAIGFFLHSVTILFVTLGLFGIVAALFGPVKYGILPEKLTTAELPAGNAMVEGATFLAILVGTIAGGIAVTDASYLANLAGTIAGIIGGGFARSIAVRIATTPELVVIVVIIALAVASWLFARSIPTAGPAAPSLAITPNPWTSTVALLKDLRKDARLWSGGHIVSWFWLVGSVVLSLLPAVVKDDIGGQGEVVTLGLATFVIGIAVGSWAAAAASHGTPNLALVPLGAALMALFSLVIAVLAGLMAPGTEKIGPYAVLGSAAGISFLAALCGLAIAGGLFIVPAFAAVQAWAPQEARARVIASVNVLSAAYMVASGAIVAGLQALGASPAPLLAGLGVLSLGAMVYVRRAWNGEGLGRPALKA
jgi:acyl-[acyl-carrier-protein]-phospholipid O-acyltransferase/long-chain-fatty-acid--[acyl-carrier-protein] ligase